MIINTIILVIERETLLYNKLYIYILLEILIKRRLRLLLNTN